MGGAELTDEWSVVLRSAPSIEYFKMSEAAGQPCEASKFRAA